MKILAFVDMHGNRPALNNIIERAKKEDIDILICAGDLTIFGQEQNPILLQLNKIGKPLLVIPGNHEDEEEMKKGCDKFKNCNYIHKKVWRKDDYLFIGWGSGGFSFRDKEFERHIGIFKSHIKEGDKVIFVTHAPPYGTKIDLLGKEHAGNKSFRKFIENVNPVAAISGHLHECVGKDVIGKTVLVNPGHKGKVIII